MALGAASAVWAAFLWRQLVIARAGAEPFCLGDGGGCAQLWDGGFAAAIHRSTGVPVAGWGLVWGLIAFALPALARLRPDGLPLLRDLGTAIRTVAIVGVVGVVALLGVSAQAGELCTNCVLTYLLTAAYGIVALRGSHAPARWGSGAFTAVIAAALGWALLLVPGLRTPKATTQDAGQEALAAAAQSGEPRSEPTVAASTAESGTPDAASSPAGDDSELASFLAGLNPELRQALSDVLDAHRKAKRLPEEPPRAIHGPANAPVRIVDFTDILCSHCANLHAALEYIETVAGGRFSVDPRYYPLDANCNPNVTIRGAGGRDSVRCLAARAQVCMEGRPGYGDFVGALYQQQANLTTEIIYTTAAKHIDAIALDSCLADPATETAVNNDIAFAQRFSPRGTPLVLVNGREASAFGPFLLAIILADGRTDHPLFADLPEPRPIPEH